MLKALKNGAKINPSFQPQNNKQAYLAYLCGLDIALPEPRTEEEVLLCKLCVDGGKYLHTMTVTSVHLGKLTMTLKNNSAESLTGVYREKTDAFNGATLIIRGADIGLDEDFSGTVICYDFVDDFGNIAIDKDFPFPSLGAQPNVINIRQGEVIDTVTEQGGVVITDASYLFYYNARLDSINELLACCKNVTSAENMFCGCKDLTSVDLTDLDTSQTSNFEGIFYACMSLTEIIGFSAPHKHVVKVDFPKGTVDAPSPLKRLVFKDVPNAIHSPIDISYCSFDRDGMVEMFESLTDFVAENTLDNTPEMYRKITVTGNPCVTNYTLSYFDKKIATDKGWILVGD